MSRRGRPTSLVAERAVRHLRERRRPLSSLALAREILATRAPDEATATRILSSAFAEDPRLGYGEHGWGLIERQRRRADEPSPSAPAPDPDRALLVLEGEPQRPGRPFRLTRVSAIRLRGDDVLAACGGDITAGPQLMRLRRSVRKTIDGALPVVHDAPGALRALEKWLDEPLEPPISLRQLGRSRLGLPARHDLEALVARLGIRWRETEDPLEQADTLHACLQSLRRPGESLLALRDSLAPAGSIDWSRYAFDREYLSSIPSAPGTYRFYDRQGDLLYVGKSNNLNRRIGSYFHQPGGRSPRARKLIETIHRIVYESTGSALEATLRESELIRREKPRHNVQREIEPRNARTGRSRSILILEPAPPPSVLRAYLIRGERLVDRVGIGPRGGGLKRIQRVLDDYFFSAPSGPTPAAGPDLEVELVVRWLSENRDRVVAFDPTDLPNSREVVERLRWFLSQGSPFDPDGQPILSR